MTERTKKKNVDHFGVIVESKTTKAAKIKYILFSVVVVQNQLK